MPDLTAPVTAEDLLTTVRRAIADPGGTLARADGETVSNWSARAVLAALAGDPGDLPARMADELNRLLNDTWCDRCYPASDWPRTAAAAAMSVRWEDAAVQAARLAHALAELSSLRDHRARWQTEHERAERLRAELAELRDLKVGIKSLTTESGAIEMSLHMAHDMMRACVAGFVKILDDQDAPNYVELAYSLRNDPERYTATIQRPRGKTPAEVAGEAKQQARKAEAERDALKAEQDQTRHLLATLVYTADVLAALAAPTAVTAVCKCPPGCACGHHSPAPARTPVTAATEAHGETTEAQEG